MVNKSLEIAGRVKGREVFVDSWAVEKLWKVAEAIVETRDVGLEDVEELQETWCNLVKLAPWMAGNTSAYDEELTRTGFVDGEGAMLQLLEELLSPILR